MLWKLKTFRLLLVYILLSNKCHQNHSGIIKQKVFLFFFSNSDKVHYSGNLDVVAFPSQLPVSDFTRIDMSMETIAPLPK